jgi:Tfp pilus assembly protein PilV
MHHPTSRSQRGTSLLEALVAFLVLSLGMVSIARVQSHLRLDADVARQRTEAVRLAQQDMETLRSERTFSAIASASRSVNAGTAYAIERRIEATGMPQAKAASITVRWTDRSGVPQQIALHSVIAATDPRLSGALALASR